METIKLMNGSAWVFAGILILMVIIQALLFLRMALSFNKKHKVLTGEEVNQAVRTGAIAAVGPALSTITVALSLIAMVGSGVTFMRCGVIGAPAWELFMASTSSAAAGVEFGSPEFTPAIFTLCIFGMTWASAPYFINTIITLKPLDAMANKASQSNGSRSFPSISFSWCNGRSSWMFCNGLHRISTFTCRYLCIWYRWIHRISGCKENWKQFPCKLKYGTWYDCCYDRWSGNHYDYGLIGRS